MTTKPATAARPLPAQVAAERLHRAPSATDRVLIEPSRDGAAVVQGMQEAAWDIARSVMRERAQAAEQVETEKSRR
jgi:hypothetical protein